MGFIFLIISACWVFGTLISMLKGLLIFTVSFIVLYKLAKRRHR